MAFTSITAETPWNSLALAQEVYQACLHRCGAAYATTKTAWDGRIPLWDEPSTSTPVFTFIRKAQQFILAHMTAFSPPSIALTADSEIVISPYGSSSFAEETGLDGKDAYNNFAFWRRVPEGATPPTHAQWADYDWEGYSYGPIQQKDVAGPWLWADIMAALVKMTRTVAHSPYSSSNTVEYRYEKTSASRDSTPPYAALTGNIILPVVPVSGVKPLEVEMYRNPWAGSSTGLRIELRLREAEYYVAPGVSVTNKMVVSPRYDSSDWPGSIFGVSASEMGKTIARDPLSTRTADGRHYFRCGLVDPSALIGVSRESVLDAVIPWSTDSVAVFFTTGFAYLVSDYVFPDGPPAA